MNLERIRATRSAAARMLSKFTRRLPSLCRYQLHPNRHQQKSGLAPTHPCDRLRVKVEYIPTLRQKQDTAHAAAASWLANRGSASHVMGHHAGLYRLPEAAARAMSATISATTCLAFGFCCEGSGFADLFSGTLLLAIAFGPLRQSVA